MPIDVTLAAQQVDFIVSVVEFQTTLSYLESPPARYPHPPVDIVGGPERIRESVLVGNYTNEFEFEFDIYALVNKAFDGHLAVQSALIGLFEYSRNVDLVSISRDGMSLPQVYIEGEYDILYV